MRHYSTAAGTDSWRHTADGVYPMKPVRIDSLISGRQYEEPLYDGSRKLLLARGKTLTQEMVVALKRSPNDVVYLGEWNEVQFRRLQKTVALAEQKEAADELAESLREEMEQALSGGKMKVPPSADGAFSAEMNTEFRDERDASEAEERREAQDRGEQFLTGVVEGNIHSDDVVAAADDVVGDLTKALQTDRSLLQAMTRLEQQSDYRYRHTLNVTVHALGIGADMGLDKEQLRQLGISSILQDLGMSMIDREVVEEPRKLTPSEFVDIQKHPIYSLHAIKNMRGLPYVSRFVAYQMHERADSTGYPSHRPKNLIHTYAQIASVADVYDAMINVRPWRPAYHPCRAMEILIAESSAGKFDTEIVRSFLHTISLYPVGCCVTLDSGEIARVVHANGKSIDRPVVAVLIGADGRELPKPLFRDLYADQSHRVVDIAPMDIAENHLAGICS